MLAPIRIGIIANPVSARDIRRVMSHAAGLPLAERANMVLRIVQALAACGVRDDVVAGGGGHWGFLGCCWCAAAIRAACSAMA